jgi:hypothetical protein
MRDLAERGAPVQHVAAGAAAGDDARVEQDPQVVADRADRQSAGRRQVRRAQGLVQEAQQRRAVRADEAVKAAMTGGVTGRETPRPGSRLRTATARSSLPSWRSM